MCFCSFSYTCRGSFRPMLNLSNNRGWCCPPYDLLGYPEFAVLSHKVAAICFTLYCLWQVFWLLLFIPCLLILHWLLLSLPTSSSLHDIMSSTNSWCYEDAFNVFHDRVIVGDYIRGKRSIGLGSHYRSLSLHGERLEKNLYMFYLVSCVFGAKYFLHCYF